MPLPITRFRDQLGRGDQKAPRVKRLPDMGFKPGLQCTLPVFLTRVRCQCEHRNRGMRASHCAELVQQFVAVRMWHADIADDKRR